MNVFDMIGPIMIGPSSSHTAGAVRLGRVAWKVLDEEPVQADIRLAGSFAETYRGHGTDKALLAGCMGMHSYDEDIRRALEIADGKGIQYRFSTVHLPDAHPNTAIICLTGKSGRTATVEGASIGGGNILVDRVDGLNVAFTGQNDTYLIRHQDRPGVIAAVTNFMMYSEVNISNFRLSRKKKGGEALMMIEVDGAAPKELLKQLEILPHVTGAILIRAI